jgi:hypothetical protein
MGDVTNVLQNVLSAKESSKVVDENGNAPTQKRKASNGSPQRHIIISRK